MVMGMIREACTSENRHLRQRYASWSCEIRNLSSSSLAQPKKGNIWGFPKIRGTFLGVPIIRTVVYLGLYWGPPILGNYH